MSVAQKYRIAAIVPVGLRHLADGGTATGTAVRESPQFFAAITQVREALRGRDFVDATDPHSGAHGAL